MRSFLTTDLPVLQPGAWLGLGLEPEPEPELALVLERVHELARSVSC